jgi:type IV pilus assembly protein PilA
MAPAVEWVYTAPTAELSTATPMSTPPFQPPPTPHPGFAPQAYATPPGYGAPLEPLKRPAGVIVIAILNIFGGLGGLVYAAFMALFAATTSNSEAPGLPIFLVVFAVALAAMAAVSIATAIGLLMLKPWARTCQMVLSGLGLLAIPIGTVINGIILYYLTRPGLRLLFSGRPAESFSYDERQLMARGSGQGAMIAVAVLVLFFGGIMLTGIIAAIAIPGLLRARMAGNEASAIGTLRSMNSGQAVWASAVGRGTYGTPACLGAPQSCGVESATPFLSSDVASLAPRSGYRFGFLLKTTQPLFEPTPAAPVEGDASGTPSDADVQRQLESLASGEAATPPPPVADTSSADPVASGFVYWAVPETPGTSGSRAFCTDEAGTVYEYATPESWTDPTEADPQCPSGGAPLQ